MGLDMYLEARVSTYHRDSEPLRAKLEKLVQEEGLPLCKNLAYINLTMEVAYWRKANQVHGWFVREVQGGRDECQRSEVEHGKLVELRDLCRRTMETRDSSLLPPTAGFFFGSGVDEWYWDCLEQTDTQLTALIEHPKFEELEFFYHSSW